jgi:hypothetical protein
MLSPVKGRGLKAQLWRETVVSATLRRSHTKERRGGGVQAGHLGSLGRADEQNGKGRGENTGSCFRRGLQGL